MWIPPTAKLKDFQKFGEYMKGSADLAKLLSKCTDISAVFNFAMALNEAISINIVSEADKAALLEEYQKIKEVTSPDLIKDAFEGNTVLGLSPADFN
ncbi:hypothetical protein WDW37_17455 [Bdellovibrionota bacterium FG-1]